jgi:Rieske Fe-S protein
MSLDDLQIPRQHVLRGAGVLLTAGALAACGNDSGEPAVASDTTPPAAPPNTSDPAAAPQSGVLTKASDVPVGSGVIVGDVVVTQPSAGDFKGFSAKCTHKGCTVNAVANGTIDCPCHGSKFNLDGTVANGPATEPLQPKAVSVDGQDIVLA